MRLLLISNSTMPGEAYLDYPKREIAGFLGIRPVTALFLPFAAVTFSYDDYELRVEERFSEVGHHVTGIHRCENPVAAVRRAEAIVVGGGNTWQLVRKMHELGLMEPIREKVLAGTPFIGWSAGANVACPTLRTTNDMPVTDPLSFNTLELIPFQINPHYLDANPEGHAGETREQRILEFLEINPGMTVMGLREGTMLRRENDRLSLIGNRSARIFRHGQPAQEWTADDDFTSLLNPRTPVV